MTMIEAAAQAAALTEDGRSSAGGAMDAEELWYTKASAGEILEALPTIAVPQASASVRHLKVGIIGGSVGGLAAAACLAKAGFQDVAVFERTTAEQSGAGISLDDASAAVLKGLGCASGLRLQKMRWIEEKTRCGATLSRQPYPFSGVLYAELVRALRSVALEVSSGRKATAVDAVADGVEIRFEDGAVHRCDVCIGADGPRSLVRRVVDESDDGTLRFAGYSALRGTLTPRGPEEAALRRDFRLFSNCNCFLLGEGAHAVLYDIGGGRANWLVYENARSPRGGAKTTRPATGEEVARVGGEARRRWGDGLGGLIEATEDPFWTDVYDLEKPLETFRRGRVAVLGDAAHAITPHLGKGSNLALQDAFVLAACAATAADADGWLAAYSAERAGECGDALLYSRHLGRVRNGLDGGGPPRDAATYEAAARAAGLPTAMLPAHPAFRAVRAFAEARVPEARRGFCLRFPS